MKSDASTYYGSEAERRARIADQVVAERVKQGLPAELTDQQLDAIGAVWACRPRPCNSTDSPDK